MSANERPHPVLSSNASSLRHYQYLPTKVMPSVDLIGIFYIVVITVSVTTNSLVLVVYWRRPSKLVYHEKLVASMCFCDLLQATIAYIPEMMGLETNCEAIAFFITFLAFISITHLSLMAIERCVKIYNLGMHVRIFGKW